MTSAWRTNPVGEALCSIYICILRVTKLWSGK